MEHEHIPGERCVVCEEGMEAYLKQADEIIKRSGWLVQAVGAGGGEPPFAYSVGMCQFGLPEIMIVGPFQQLQMHLINQTGFLMKADGAFSDWSQSDKIIRRFFVVFRELDESSVHDNCGMLLRFFGVQKVLQLILPDQNGRFPWDAGCAWTFQEEGLKLRYASPVASSGCHWISN